VDLGTATADGALSLAVGDETVDCDASEIRETRAVLERELD
jgi:hypothetical protein